MVTAKKRIEDRFADQVRGRVAVHSTRYRRAHDQASEVWLTIDGQRICTFSDITHYINENTGGPPCPAGWDIRQSLFDSLSESIGDMLASADPLIRAIAVLDKRCGQRRLRALVPQGDLMKICLDLRLENLFSATSG
ncbi:hypothetical protein [Halovulum sp. GXIMD14793]